MAKWTFDPQHSDVNFVVRHLVVSKVHGRFTKWEGSMTFDEKNPTASTVEAKIDAASVDTHDAQRDGHLKSADFFETDKFPTITFKSTKIEGTGGDLKMTGDLTMHGVTKPITLDVEFAGRAKHPMNNSERAGFSAKGTLNRKDFGLAWNLALEAGGLAVSEKVELTFDVQAILDA